MSKIKICGLKREEDINYVNETKPDFAGFVFAGAKRKIDFKTAEKFKSLLSKDIKSAGVFANEKIENISALHKDKIIDLIQLHGEEGEGYIKELKDKTGAIIIKTVKFRAHFPPPLAGEGLVKREGDGLPVKADFLLFDSETGGSGKTFDWRLIKDYPKPFFLAGGINADNISEALKLNPYCIDLSSGVETGGAKDFDKIKKIIEIVRKYKQL
ncbi:MAG: phosphoribosylanthranilate isomerase [Endomicrobium sp.]|nr:phosphoribosylanthranilate isomerase [Endomicrobium sp.]